MKSDKKENKKRNKEKKKNKTWKIILIVLLLLVIALGGWFAYKTHKNGGGLTGMLATVVGHDENTKKNLPELKILLLGVSTDLGDNAPTDTIMVASYNPNTQKANLLSIPRDTFIGKNKNKATPSDKINALYSISVDKTLQAVNDLTGLDIKYYAVIKTNALIELVDAIGGVEFNVPIKMYYTDKTQNLKIDLQPGMQKLNGDKAEQLLRFRKNNNGTSYPEEYGDNDTGRMRTQREFIMAVLQQTLKPGNIFKIGEIIDIASKNIETNLDMSYLKDYIPYAVEFNTENLTTETIPGVNKQLPEKTKEWWFFEADKEETAALIQKLFYSSTENGEGDNTNDVSNEISTNNSSNSTSSNSTSNKTTGNSSKSNISNVADSANTKLSKSEIRIEVLNGSGDADKLQKAVELLKEEGYDVTKTGKTSSISKTIITNKKELDDATVKEIKNVLGVGSISNNKNLSSKVHVTVVIGSDFDM